MKVIFILIVFSVVLVSCNELGRHNEITKVELATGGCLGSCQQSAVSIDSALNYIYYGGNSGLISNGQIQKNLLSGYYAASASKLFWDSLNYKLREINYKRLDTLYNHSMDDQSFELIVHYNDKVKHIKAQSRSLPEDVRKVFYWIADSYMLIKPKQIKDTLKFETTIQGPFY